MPARTRWQRRFYLSLGLVCSLLLLSACEPTPRVQLLEGGALDWESYRGKWVFINYWAEWCLPCRKEMPELNHFASRFADQVVVLGVNFDGLAKEQLARSAQDMMVEFPVLVDDPGAWLGHQRPSVLPTTVVYDPRGELQAVLTGPQTVASLRQLLQPANASGAARHP